MNKIKKIIITSIMIASIDHMYGMLPPKPIVSSTCAEKNAQANAYISNVQYLRVLSEFINELQKIVQRCQNVIERSRREMTENQTRIGILKEQAKQKKESIAALQAEIRTLIDNTQIQFRGLTNALCRHEAAKTILMASQIITLNREKYFNQAAKLMETIFPIMEACKKAEVSADTDVLDKLQSAYAQATSTSKQEGYSKRAAKLFEAIQLRILNEYLILTQKERPAIVLNATNSLQPFPEIDASPAPEKEVVNNLIELALKAADPKIFEQTTSGFTERINKEIKNQELSWLRDIALYKFGYSLCTNDTQLVAANCERECKNIKEDQQGCIKNCKNSARNKLGWQIHDCQETCKTAVESCQKFCKEGCDAKCNGTQTTCLKSCQEENKRNDDNWNYCVSCNSPTAGEKCAHYQPLGLVDIQGEIAALAEQITPTEPEKAPSLTNIPAKINRIMGKINQIKSIITDAQTAVDTTQSAVKSTTISSLLPANKNAKSACATSIQSILNTIVALEPAKAAAKKIEAQLTKTYGED